MGPLEEPADPKAFAGGGQGVQQGPLGRTNELSERQPPDKPLWWLTLEGKTSDPKWVHWGFKWAHWRNQRGQKGS